MMPKPTCLRYLVSGLLLLASPFMTPSTSDVFAADRSAQVVMREVTRDCLHPEVIRNLDCTIHSMRSLPESYQESYDRHDLFENWIDPLFAEHEPEREREESHGLLSLIEELNQSHRSCRALSLTSRVCDIENTNAQEFDFFVQLFRSRVLERERGVPSAKRPFFRAFAAKCAVSVILSYEEREHQGMRDFVQSRFFSSIEDIWARGVGECQEIARLTTELGRALEIPMWNTSTLFHEFNATEINGETLYLDAGSPTCTFFRPR